MMTIDGNTKYDNGGNVIKVPVEWTGDNFCCGISSEEYGTIAVTHKTLNGLKKSFEEALSLHIEGCLADGDVLPDYLVKGNYTLDYELDTAALLRDAENFTTLTVISRLSGINVKQLSHYVNGLKKARRQQRDRIVNGLHEIGRQVLALH